MCQCRWSCTDARWWIMNAGSGHLWMCESLTNVRGDHMNVWSGCVPVCGLQCTRVWRLRESCVNVRRLCTCECVLSFWFVQVAMWVYGRVNGLPIAAYWTQSCISLHNRYMPDGIAPVKLRKLRSWIDVDFIWHVCIDLCMCVCTCTRVRVCVLLICMTECPSIYSFQLTYCTLCSIGALMLFIQISVGEMFQSLTHSTLKHLYMLYYKYGVTGI